jgi:hypothetical protein
VKRRAAFSSGEQLPSERSMSAAAAEARPEDFTDGLTVALRDKPDEFGIVRRRDAQRVRVDFPSGGSWKECKELIIVPAIDVLNLSAESGPATSDDEPELTVVEVGDVAKARFCKKCVAEHAVFEQHDEKTACAGGHANFHYAKKIPDGIRVVQRTTQLPRTVDNGLCLPLLGSLGTVVEEAISSCTGGGGESRGGAEEPLLAATEALPDMNRDEATAPAPAPASPLHEQRALSSNGPGCFSLPACLSLGALSASAGPHDTSAPALAVLTHSDIGHGLLVRRVDDAASHGTVLGRQARRVRVDFSASGGSPSTWVENWNELTATTENLAVHRARWVELRSQFSQGAHAKTAEGVVSLVIMDARLHACPPQWSAEGMHANEVKLQLADGSQSDWVKVETLSEATQAEVTEYNAAPWVLEQARKATLRAQFRRGTHAKTADGAVGVVMDEAPAEGPDANTVHLQLAADGSQTGRLSLDTLTVATEAEYEAEVARCGTEHEAEVARAKLAVDDHNLRHWGRTIG